MRRVSPAVTRRVFVLSGALAVTGAVIYATSRVPAGRSRVSQALLADDWTGRSAPDFTLSTLDTRRVRLSEYRGRVVVLNFWATWCAPCRLEMPWLAEFDRIYRDQGLAIVGVSVDDGARDKVERFVNEVKVSYTILLNEDEVSDAYGGVRFLPQTFFIGRDGRIAGRIYGTQSKGDLEGAIRQALGVP